MISAAARVASCFSTTILIRCRIGCTGEYNVLSEGFMGRPKRTLEECQEVAQKHGGACLSTKYINERGKLHWRCAKGHEWESSAACVVRAKTWCKRCSDAQSALRKRHSIEDCQVLAATKGGACLSSTYKNSKDKLLWRCNCGHVWSASFNAVHNGTWCINCANERKRQTNNLGIEKMHELAAKHHGKCLSRKYDNVNSVLEWECSERHRFCKRVSNVIAGHWCDTCNYLISERLCRAIFEHLYDDLFARCRPTWLIGEKGVPLELDGYNEKLKIAFEYQGIQHFQPVVKFKVCGERLRAIRARDDLKKSITQARGVVLIRIPYTVEHCKLEEYIRQQLKNHGKGREAWARLPFLDLWSVEVRVNNKLKQIRNLGAKKNLECLSENYARHDTPLLWKCRTCGNEFPYPPDRLANAKAPCGFCRAKARREDSRAEALEKIRAFLSSRGERLLSTRFEGQNVRLSIVCPSNHRWSSSWACLRHGVRCNQCRDSGLLK